MIAQIIVDVPLMQTDNAYSYQIPSEMEAVVEKGVLVTVPFGRGNQLKQGFVVDVIPDNDEDEPLKTIASVDEAVPVLNDELLQLADWLANETFAFKITCLQTMLPNALKKKYNVYYQCESDDETVRQLFQGSEIKAKEDFTPEEQRQLLRLEKAGAVSRQYRMKKKVGIKKEWWFKRIATDEALAQRLEKTASRAIKQQECLYFLQQQSMEWQQENHTPLQRQQFKWAEAQQLIVREEREVYRRPITTTVSKAAHQLNDEQAEAVTQVVSESQAHHATPFLLEGITGSGKTEVYMHIIQEVLAAHQTALVLVPEIALTPQITARFQQRFGKKVAVLHSQLSDGERYDEWRRIRRGEAQIVVGARSAIFAPLEHLGVIIIDEEHETSYKQEEMPRYHARDVALWRSRYHHCPVVLGSATPSLETRARAETGVYQMLRLTKRANPGALLPTTQLVDLSKEPLVQPGSAFSYKLAEQIYETLVRDEKVVLLLNRRGYSSFLMCRDCGHVLQCPNCDISLTLHMQQQQMKCHYCGHEEAIPHHCPACHSQNIRYYGTGTEKIEQELHQLFPQETIIRMDVDTTRRKGAHEKLLHAFEKKEARILLGTQMIAKGLDFPDVTLVGVLNADTALYLPDFHASERTYQLLTQVSGRAGRGQKQGQVLIQTYNPEHYAIQLACRQQYDAFFYQEMQVRHTGHYSPYYYTVAITIKSEDDKLACRYAKIIKEEIEPYLPDGAIILGPTHQAIAKMKKQYYYQMMIKYKHEGQLFTKLKELVTSMQMNERKGLYITIDREPLSFI